MLHFPLLVLSLVIATMYGALFHLLWGQAIRELLIYWVAAVAGFASGQLLASAFSWPDLLIGELHFMAASAASWLFMAFAKRLKS
jgi:hypothetical protein